MLNDQWRDQFRRYQFVISAELYHDDIAAQVPFVYALEQAQKIMEIRPRPRGSIRTGRRKLKNAGKKLSLRCSNQDAQ